MNKVILIGNIVRDIEMRYAPNGTAIAKTAIATNRRWTDANGQKQERTMFIDITFFGRLAETAQKYLLKGKKVAIDGELVLEEWTAQDGTKRSKHTVTVNSMEMLSPAQQQGAPAQPGYQQPAQPGAYPQPQQAYPQPQPAAPAQQAYPQPQPAPQPAAPQPQPAAAPQPQPAPQPAAPAQQAYPQPQPAPQPAAPQPQPAAAPQQQPAPQQPAIPEIDIDEEDIPF